MKTEQKNQPAVKDAVSEEMKAVKTLFQGDIEIGKIETNSNARRSFDGEKMKELQENIRQNGLLVPILVAKASKGGYMLIAGERRLRAAKALGHKSIPAKVVEADEKRIEELQLFENLHREGLGPIEEARAFKKLLDNGKHTIPGLAKRVDKTVKYVTRSIRLLELPAKAFKAIEDGVITPEHGHQILRVPENKRERLVEFALAQKWGGVLPTIHELKREIESRMERELSRACFPKDREYAGEKACSECPFNTGNQDVLFEGARSGSCTNGQCFTKKSNLFLKEFKEQAEKRLPKLKCVGIGSADGSSQVKGAAILSPEEAKSEKVKALMEKEPEKFGFAVMKPSSFGSKAAPATVLVCTDKALLESKIRKPAGTGQRAMTPEEKGREQFIQEAERKALFKAAAKALGNLEKGHIIDIILALNGSEEAFNAVGITESEDLSKTLSKLTEKELFKLAWLCTVSPWEADENFKGLNLDAKAIRREARGKALAEWDALQKKAKEAPAKENPPSSQNDTTKGRA